MKKNNGLMNRLRRMVDTYKDLRHPNEYELVPYLIDDGKKHPVAIICPGGGYAAVCSFVEGKPFARRLNEMGFHAVVVYYHIREKALYPAPQNDLARAVRDVHEKAEAWNLDVRNYSIWGSSAGGHLVASFGTEIMGYAKYGLPKPGALVLTYPVVTMGELTHQGSRDNLLGTDASEEMIDMASVEKQVTASYPPTFLWCGDIDSVVPCQNCHMLDHALQEAGIPHEFVEYPGVDHGVGLGEGQACEGWIDRAVAFWQAQKQ